MWDLIRLHKRKSWHQCVIILCYTATWPKDPALNLDPALNPDLAHNMDLARDLSLWKMIRFIPDQENQLASPHLSVNGMDELLFKVG